MAMKIPLVATSKGCQGIDVEHGKNIMIADNNEEFAEYVIKVLKDKKLSKQLAKEGYKVAQKYSWANIYSMVEQTIRDDLHTLRDRN